MPFTNYTDLQAEIVLWLGDRPDLTARIPSFITLAEEALSGGLRCREQHERSIALLTEEFEWLPDDFAKIDTVRFSAGDGKYIRLTFRTMAQLDAMPPAEASGTPVHFSIVGPQIRFWPAPTPFETPDGVDPDLEPEKCRHFELVYWTRIASLTATEPVNVVLERYPSLYLYGTLVQAEPYMVGDERLPMWATKYEEALARANGMDKFDTQSTPAITTPEDAP